MENENNNEINVTSPPQSGEQNNLQAYVQESRKKRNRNIFVGVLVAVFTLVLGYFTYTGTELFKAEITEVSTLPAGVDTLYIPSYEGAAGEDGLMAIKSNVDFTEPFDTIFFTLTFNPVNGLIFDNNPVVFTPSDPLSPTLFESAPLNLTNYNATTGKLDVTIKASAPVQPNAGDIIFKLNTLINPVLATGQVITMGIENYDLYNVITPLTTAGDMVAGTITAESTDSLMVLNAESKDSTHIEVNFSDDLLNYGNANYYRVFENDGGIFGDELSVISVQLNSNNTSVNLTTVDQEPGIEYVVVIVGEMIEGNQDGFVKTGFESALFYGYGEPTSSFSDFGIVSAEVVSGSYNQIEVVFTEDINEASIDSTDFAIPLISVTGATLSLTSDDTVLLTVSTPLLSSEVYTLTVTGVTSVSDNDLGINKTSFMGSNNGPRISNAVADSAGQVTITFDVDIELDGTSGNPVGHLYVLDKGADLASLTLDAYPVSEAITTAGGGELVDFVYEVDGQTITMTHDIFTDATAHYVFAVSTPEWVVDDTYDVATDSSYNTISFWGHDYTGTDTIGTLSVVNKNTIEVMPGTIDFTDVDDTRVEVLYSDGATLGEQTTDSISTVGLSTSTCPDCKLVITFDANLEPNRRYVLRITDGTDTLITETFSIEQTLSVVSAEAIADNQIMVEFSENIDSSTLEESDEFITSPVLTITDVDIQSDFRHVILTTSSVMTPNAVYTVNAANGTTPIYAYAGGNILGKSIVAFSGYGATGDQSDVMVTSVDNVSSTELQITFSDTVNFDSPVDITIKELQVTACTESSTTCILVADTLGVSSVTGSGSTYTVTTSKQTAETNYFVVMDGVTDTDTKVLGNAKVHNFFGFALPRPTVTNVTPGTIINDIEQTVIITGSNLDIVETVKIGNQTVTFTTTSATSITVTVPVDMAPDSYDIVFIDDESQITTFANALLILAPETPMQVLSDQSHSIPMNVPNDDTTLVTLWVLVKDPVGLGNISDVTVNLAQIGGPASQVMDEDQGIQPQYSQWYTYEVTIPPTVATAIDPYLLPVEVHKGTEIASGTVSVHVTGDVYQSVAPTIDQVYANPVSVPPNNETEVTISAKVTDIDGADGISSVIADLGSVGIGFVPLIPLDTGEATELVTRFYQSEPFTIPTITPTGAYTINVTASDDTGESSVSSFTINVSTDITGPNIDPVKTYIAPRKSIPRNGVTAFSIHAYVTDPDGVGDIATVTASFGAIGIPPTALIKDSNASDTAKSAYFAAEGLTIPTTASFGLNGIEITAEDSSGGLSNLVLTIDVTNKDTLGDPPVIIQDKGYTTPKVAINDGETPITLYVFVRDDDNDVESVVANLSSIGQVGPEIGSDFASPGSSAPVPIAGSGSCPTGINTLVCMTPSLKEGSEGQWFILPGVTISKNTMPSTGPYMVDIIASDITGKTTHGSLPVYVNDGESFTNDRLPPEVVLAVPTNSTTVEVLFSEELSATSISPDGREFKITDKDDITKELQVVGATINAIGTIVTLSTENQDEDGQYVLSANGDILDAVGVSLIVGAANRVFFNGFDAKNKIPVIDYVTALDVDLIEVEFRDYLKPSSLKLAPVTREQAPLTARDFNVEVFEVESGEELPVYGVAFGNYADTLLVLTAPQKGNTRYRVQIKDIASYDGKKPPVGIIKTYKSYNVRAVQHQAAANMADLNGDGSVDFTDFTIFSSVYGTVYYQIMQDAMGALDTGGQPIEPEPDALVPITSEPAGGYVESTSSIPVE